VGSSDVVSRAAARAGESRDGSWALFEGQALGETAPRTTLAERRNLNLELCAARAGSGGRGLGGVAL
jgi:hypothetical protein